MTGPIQLPPAEPDAGTPSDRVVALIRTVVPALWAAGLALLIRLGLPAGVVHTVGDPLADDVLVPLVLATFYAGVQWLARQRWFPAWAHTALMGSAKSPTYRQALPPAA